MKEKLGKNTIKKGNSVAVFIFLIFKYRKKKFKESLKLVSVKKTKILHDILHLFAFCY